MQTFNGLIKELNEKFNELGPEIIKKMFIICCKNYDKGNADGYTRGYGDGYRDSQRP